MFSSYTNKNQEISTKFGKSHESGDEEFISLLLNTKQNTFNIQNQQVLDVCTTINGHNVFNDF